MKKFLLIIAVVVLCLSIVACGGKNGADQTTNEQNNNEIVETTKEQADQSGETSTKAEDACMIINSTKTELSGGDEFTLTVSIKNNPGIWAFMFELPINAEVFEFVGADISESICTMPAVCDYDESTSSYKFNATHSSFFDNLTADGTMATITLRVKDSAAAGVYSISANPDAENIINVDGDFVVFSGASISINVAK